MPIGTVPVAFDPTDDIHARTLSRLASEQIAWIGTTGRDGYPLGGRGTGTRRGHPRR